MKTADSSGREIQLPDFLLVGAAKSATTSLHNYLDQHPQIAMPSVKESWFFSFVDKPPAYVSPNALDDVVSDLDSYLALFDGAGLDQLLGDASPSYLYTFEDTIANLKNIYPEDKLSDLKIIISLREPVGRAFSQYNTFRRVVHEPLQFEEAVQQEVIAKRLRDNWNIFYDYLGFGLYSNQVRAFIDFFGKENVLVVFYDEVQSDPVALCQKMFRFLDVDSSFEPDVETRHNSLTGEPRIKWLVKALTSRNSLKRKIAGLIPQRLRWALGRAIVTPVIKRSTIPEKMRVELTEFYRDDIEELEKLLNIDLAAWK